MSEIALVAAALPRIERACRRRRAIDHATGVRLTEKQLRTLEPLDRLDPVMVTELAEFLGVTASTMSLNLSRMERSGLVRRSRDPADRRVMNVLLTEEGERLRSAASPLDPSRVAAVLDILRPDERARAMEGLRALAEAADTLMARGEAYIEALGGDGPI